MIDKFRFHENVYMNKAEDPADGARGSSADENHKPSRDDERVRELNAASGKEAGSVRLHPLFDELSSYRMRTLLSTFSDDGSTGIRDFMDKWHTTLGSCLRSLGELERRPDNPAWSDELNQAMGETFEYMLETEPSTLMTEQRVETLVGDSVLCATMTNGKVEVRPIPGSEEEATITGLTKKGVAHPAGEQVSGPFGPVSSKLEIDIPLDSVNREGRVDLVEGQRVMFMILSAEKLNRMAALLEMPLTREFFPPVSVSPPPHDVGPNEPVISMEGAQKVIQKVLETIAS